MRTTFMAVTMHEPAVYRIHVRGNLHPSWSDRVGGMQITGVRGNDGGPETILIGTLLDQAALAGILNSLFELHLPILSFYCVGTVDC